MNILLKRNYKIFNYEQVFGSTSDFTLTLLVDAGHLDLEPMNSVLCTCFSADNVYSAETGKIYDHNWLWIQMNNLGKASAQGASPEDAFYTAIKSGLKVVPTGEIDTPVAYFRVDQGIGTPFDNIKSAIQLEYNKGFKRPVEIGSWWYAEWGGVLPNGIMPLGKTHTSNHSWEICGWDEEHPDCFKINSWEGYYKYMPKNVFNAAMSATSGAMGLTFAQTEQEVIDYLKNVKISLIQWALDLCYNLLQKWTS